MRGKGAPALFELIREKSRQEPATPPAAAPPEPLAEEPAPVVRPAGRPWWTASAPDDGSGLDRRVTLPVSALLLGVAAILIGLTIVWTTGYNLGWNRGEARAVKDLGADPGAGAEVRDPLNADIPVNPGLLGSNSTVPAPARPVPAPSPGPTPTGDPRQPGLNYYLLATLDRLEAQRCADFLGANGLPALTVAVDPKGPSGNNPPRFEVYVARGISRTEYSERSAARREVETTARRLGERWKREFKSSTDFSDAYWKKHAP